MKTFLVTSLHCASARLIRHPALMLAAILPLPGFSQNTLPDIEAVYPNAAFAAFGEIANVEDNYDTGNYKKLLNIVTHFGAIPNGTAANAGTNTAAFKKAFAFIKERQRVAEERLTTDKEGANCEEPSAQWIIWIPNGTYYVNDTLTYDSVPYEYFRGVRLIGQSCEGTIIQLVNNASNFNDADEPKAVISFDSPAKTFNNWQGHNMLKNMTINVGSGNAGAVGVDFFSPNTGRIDNVKIMSVGGGNQWAGAIGLRFRIGIVHGYMSNITIDGFDVGISLEPYHMCNPTLEYITLRNQKIAAIHAVNGGASMRKIASTQGRGSSTDSTDTLGLLIDSGTSESAGSHIVVIDSSFTSTRIPATSKPAINIVGRGPSLVTGHLFARDITTSGYTTGIKKAGAVENYNGEYVSHPTPKFRFNNSGTHSSDISMELSIAAPPTIPKYTNVNGANADWVTAGVGNGTTDDADAIEAQMASSQKPVFYFPKQKYYIGRPINVPATVKRIELMATELIGSPNAYFNISESSSDPLFISDLNDGAAVLVSFNTAGVNRTLVLDSNRQSNVRNHYPSASLKRNIFVNNGNKFLLVQGTANTSLEESNAWCRFINNEDKDDSNWIVETGGTMWVLGYKCEGATTNFEVHSGGKLEVLGGIANQYTFNWEASWPAFNDKPGPYNSMLVNLGGEVTYVGCTNGPDNPDYGYFDYLIRDVQGSATRNIKTSSSSVPPRTGRVNQFVMPIYNSHN